jgi:hypothetical protein
MAKQTITPGAAPIVWSTVEDAFTKINANFTELYASVGGTGIEFDALESSLVPAQNDTYDLGTPQKRWASLYLSDTLMIGGAAITNEGLTVNLPSGTTVGGNLIIDPDKAFFKEFSVNSETSVVANQFNDVLDFNAGTGIQLTVTSTNDQINITNTGVTSLVAGTAMAVSASTGTITVNNTGVTAVTAGLGMSRNTATGAVTIVNEGIVEIVSGNITNLTVGARDAATGRVVITNTKPGGNAYGTFAILNSGSAVENNLVATSTSTTVQFQEGAGINLIGTTTAGVNRVEVVNTGVTALTAGNGVTLSSSTGNITVSIGRGDLIGSVFADDSTMMVDATGNTVSGTTVTGGVVRLTGGTISTTDSSGIAVITATTFNSDVTVENELTVNGNLIVKNKNIELRSIASPTDATADGGGITLKGTTDKTFNYVNSTGLWTANIGIEAASFTGPAATATTASTAASVGYMGVPQSTITTTNTLTIADAGKHIYVNTASQTITIPANTAVPYPIGTAISFVAGPSAVSVTIAITTDIMYLVGTGGTGSRTLAAFGTATAIKVSATAWYINGTGLT